MENGVLLILAIAERVYTETEWLQIYKLDLERHNLNVQIERVSEKELVQAAKQRKPVLILGGFRGSTSDPELLGTSLDTIFKTLKSDPETRDIPILMTEAISDLAQRAQECGVDAYLSIPFRRGEVYTIVSRLTGLDEQDD